MAVVTQDDDRQNLIATHCGLNVSTHRYGADAVDQYLNEYELKSGTTKSYISTARDFNLNTLVNYRSKYWIIGSGSYKIHKSKKMFMLHELYCAHPSQLEWFFGEQERVLRQNMELLNRAEKILKEQNAYSIHEYHMFRRIIVRGNTLNDPRMKMSIVRETCTILDPNNSQRATEQLQEFVQAHPLCKYSVQGTYSKINHNADKFFGQ